MRRCIVPEGRQVLEAAIAPTVSPLPKFESPAPDLGFVIFILGLKQEWRYKINAEQSDTCGYTSVVRY